jgi:hypothetical protein
MIIHRKPSSSASAASAKAKMETHASQPSQPPQQKEHRNDDEDEKTRQGIFDHSKREEAAGSFDYTSTTIKVKGKGSTATATHDVSKREKSCMTMRSESILSWSWLGVWGIVAVYLFLSKVLSSRSWRKVLTTCYSKLNVSSETELIIENLTASFAEYAFVPDRRIYLPEVIKSIIALTRLEKVLIKYKHVWGEAVNQRPQTNVDKSEIEELIYYIIFAIAAYKRNPTSMLMRCARVNEDDIIMRNWEANVNKPSFYVVRDRERKALVLGIRGIASAADVLTTFNTNVTKLEQTCSSGSKMHSGIVASAVYISEMTVNTITDELKHNPTYSLAIVGHSMGGGVAAILGSMWKQRFENRVKSITYGCPRVFPMADDNYDNVVSVVHEDDPLMSICISNVIAVRDALLELCLDKRFQAEILKRTSLMLKCDTISGEDYAWCRKARSSLSQVSNEVVPGTIRLLTNDEQFLSLSTFHPDELKQWDFQLHPKTLDFSSHLPKTFQANLQRIHSSLRRR